MIIHFSQNWHNLMVLPLILKFKPNDEAQILLSTWFLYHCSVKHYKKHGAIISSLFQKNWTEAYRWLIRVHVILNLSIIWANSLQKIILTKAVFLNWNFSDYIHKAWVDLQWNMHLFSDIKHSSAYNRNKHSNQPPPNTGHL